MKKSLPVLSALAVAGILIMSFGVIRNEKATVVNTDELVYPAAVKKVIDQKCYGCHSDKGQSQDAKDALLWDKLPSLEKGKMVATLDNIIEVLENGTMPPEDVIKKYPEIKLLPTEKELLISWAESKADSLLK